MWVDHLCHKSRYDRRDCYDKHLKEELLEHLAFRLHWIVLPS